MAVSIVYKGFSYYNKKAFLTDESQIKALRNMQLVNCDVGCVILLSPGYLLIQGRFAKLTLIVT